MKKIFTLMVALGAVSGVFAQRTNPYSDRGQSHDVVVNNNPDRGYNDGRQRYDDYNSGNNYGTMDRGRDIDRINRDFDSRIRNIQYNRWMRPREKDYQISMLEQQRRQQIESLRYRYQNNRNRYDDDNHDRRNGKW